MDTEHKPNLWIPLAIIAGAGLLLWSDSKSKDSSDTIIEDKFTKNLNGYAAATKNLAPALDPAALRDTFNNGDFRSRAMTMTWLAKRAAGKSKYTLVNDNSPASADEASAANLAAANLAVDFRDKFYEKSAEDGAKANKVLEAVKLESQGKNSLRDISNALIALVTNMQEAASASATIDKEGNYLVNFTPTVTAMVNTSPDYYLEGYDSTMEGVRGTYLAKIVDRKNTPYAGEYLIISAPKAKTQV